MTKESNTNELRLQQDIESYLCGEVPNGLDMKRAAKLDNWSTAVCRHGKHFGMVLLGDVCQHPKIADHSNIRTSMVMWFDREARFARTRNRLYALGEPAGGDVPSEDDA